MHKVDYTAHPRYATAAASRENMLLLNLEARIGDEVAAPQGDLPSLGTVTAIYLDGMVELSTGDQVAAADLVLLRRAQ